MNPSRLRDLRLWAISSRLPTGFGFDEFVALLEYTEELQANEENWIPRAHHDEVAAERDKYARALEQIADGQAEDPRTFAERQLGL